MTRAELEKLIEDAAAKAQEGESRVWYIVEALERNGLLYKVNDEYQQLPVDQKQKAKFNKICKDDKCMRRARTHGYCQTHYLQARRKGLIGNAGLCMIEGCENPVEAKGLCFNHYRTKARGTVVSKADQTQNDLDR